jgi:hypothetical protein
LAFLADSLGVTYEAINVWVFVIIWPLSTLALTAAVVLQQLRVRKLLSQMGRVRRRQSESASPAHPEVRS